MKQFHIKIFFSGQIYWTVLPKYYNKVQGRHFSKQKVTLGENKGDTVEKSSLLTIIFCMYLLCGWNLKGFPSLSLDFYSTAQYTLYSTLWDSIPGPCMSKPHPMGWTARLGWGTGFSSQTVSWTILQTGWTTSVHSW